MEERWRDLCSLCYCVPAGDLVLTRGRTSGEQNRALPSRRRKLSTNRERFREGSEWRGTGACQRRLAAGGDGGRGAAGSPRWVTCSDAGEPLLTRRLALPAGHPFGRRLPTRCRGERRNGSGGFVCQLHGGAAGAGG